MEEEIISKVAKVLNDWNPLGEAACTIEDLDDYRFEAIDIISTAALLSGDDDSYREAVQEVLEGAFGLLTLDEKQLSDAASEIRAILTPKDD